MFYAQAQSEALTQATAVPSVTQPLTAAAEKEATTIIGGNFITPTLNALDPQVSIPTELTQSLQGAPIAD